MTLLLGQHPDALTVRLTAGDGARLIATATDATGKEIPWTATPSLVFADGAYVVISTHVATVTGSKAEWVLTRTQVTAIQPASPSMHGRDVTRVRITLPASNDTDGVVRYAGTVSWSDGWTAGDSTQHVRLTLPVGPAGRGVVSITDTDGDGVAMIAYSDGTTSTLQLPAGPGAIPLPTDTPAPNLVFEGDSMSAVGIGTMSTTATSDSTPGLVVNGIDPRAKLANVAEVGAQLWEMSASYNTQIAPLYDPAMNSILVLWGGTNDLAISGASAQAVLSSIAEIVAKARATGYKVIVGTLLPRSDAAKPAGFDANRATINAALRANQGGIYGDYIADPAADPRIGEDGDSDNVLYYSDKLHMTVLGRSVVAEAFRVALADAKVVIPSRAAINPLAPSTFIAPRSLGIGYKALAATTTASDSTALGYQALAAATTGGGNTAVGTESLAALTSGANNVAVGWMAAGALTTGTNSIAVGALTLTSNTTGTGNVAVGYAALKVATSEFNVAVGFQVLDALTNGSGNVGVGSQALGALTTGGNNVGIGGDALANGTTTVNNVAVGSAAGMESTGTDNTFIGFLAGARPAGVAANATTTGARQVNVGSGTGQISATQRNDTVTVGYRALVDGDNTVAIGSGAQALHANAVALGKGAVTTATDQVMIGDRNIESTRIAGGIVLRSPDGTRYQITVANGGVLTTAAA